MRGTYTPANPICAVNSGGTAIWASPHMRDAQPWFSKLWSFLGPLNTMCRFILRTQKGAIILTTTHVVVLFRRMGVDFGRGGGYQLYQNAFTVRYRATQVVRGCWTHLAGYGVTSHGSRCCWRKGCHQSSFPEAAAGAQKVLKRKAFEAVFGGSWQ